MFRLPRFFKIRLTCTGWPILERDKYFDDGYHSKQGLEKLWLLNKQKRNLALRQKTIRLVEKLLVAPENRYISVFLVSCNMWLYCLFDIFNKRLSLSNRFQWGCAFKRFSVWRPIELGVFEFLSFVWHDRILWTHCFFNPFTVLSPASFLKQIFFSTHVERCNVEVKMKKVNFRAL